MRDLKKILKTSYGTIAVGAILYIIPASVVSCSKASSNNQSNSNTITTIANSWQTQFDNLKNQSNFKNQIATWLINYANNLTSYFAAFTNQYQTLIKAILPIGLNGYACSNLPLNIALPNINKSNNNIKENTTLYWKINQVSFDQNSLKVNSTGTYSFEINYDSNYEITMNSNVSGSNQKNTDIKSSTITANFNNITFAPTILSNLDDLLNSNDINVNIFWGWYINSGTVSFSSAILSDSSSTYNINLSKTVDPTINDWIASPAICSPISLFWTDFLTKTSTSNSSVIANAINNQLTNSLWYSKFINQIFCGFANDSHNNLTTLASLTNPNLSLLNQLKNDSLNISYSTSTNQTTTSSSTSNSTNQSTSQQIDTLENEINEVIASSNNSALLSTLQNIWNSIKNL